MPDDQKNKASKIHPWRLLIKGWTEGDILPFFQKFEEMVKNNYTVRSYELSWRRLYGNPYLMDLVQDIYLRKIHDKGCLYRLLNDTKNYPEDRNMQNYIHGLVSNYVIDVFRPKWQKELLKTDSFEDKNDGNSDVTLRDANKDYKLVGFENTPARNLEIKEYKQNLEKKEKDFYKRLNEKQVFIFENCKKFERGTMTYEEIAESLKVATVTVQTNALKIEKIIKEILKD